MGRLNTKRRISKEGGRVDHLLFFPTPIIGVDEVGRGCLAGEVYAAAIILNDKKPTKGLADSKTLTASRREELAKEIQSRHQVGFGIASVEEIEELNILWASMLAMKRAIENLNVISGHVLVDGKFKIPRLRGFSQTTFIGGDSRVSPIAAASIVAKVARDAKMVELHETHPQYGFAQHKGYSTALHKSMIAKWGPCSWHRRGFSGVKEYVTDPHKKRPVG